MKIVNKIALMLAATISINLSANEKPNTEQPSVAEAFQWSWAVARHLVNCGYYYRYTGQMTDISNYTTPARGIFEDLKTKFKNTSGEKEGIEAIATYEERISRAMALDLIEKGKFEDINEILKGLETKALPDSHFPPPKVTSCSELTGLYYVYTDHIREILLEKNLD